MEVRIEVKKAGKWQVSSRFGLAYEPYIPAAVRMLRDCSPLPVRGTRLELDGTVTVLDTAVTK